MKILITGSSGQIGTNLALRCLGEGHEVLGIDRRTNTWTDRFRYVLQDLSAPYPSYPGRIGGVEYARPDVLVHLAAHAKVHQLVREPHRALENVVMTYNVVEYCRHWRVPVIYSSSREVYGDIHRFSTEEGSADFAFTESTYSASKISGEAMIYAYARCYGVPYVVFRFSNVYGRYDNDIERMERVIPLFITKISREEPITIYGREKVLDFTYVDDCVDGILLGIRALTGGQIVNKTINLAYGVGNTLASMADLVGKALGKVPCVNYAPPLLGEVTHYVASLDRARQLLGYSPKVPLAEGIRRAVEWAREWEQSHPRGSEIPAGWGGACNGASELSGTASGVGFETDPTPASTGETTRAANLPGTQERTCT
jgi:nucleoside-diphosphate-sugar epimerase